MKILVIGGTYFLGRTFTLVSGREHDLYLLNRGIYGINTFPSDLRLHELKMDRHDVNSLKEIKEEFDVVVDFCAYQKGDIKTILDNIAKPKKYIYVSTVDVYERDFNVKIDEEHDFIKDTRIFPSEFKEYVDGKLCLEDELKSEALKRGIDYISIRPGNIYGPNNYKPQFYLENILRNGQAIYPKVSDGVFNLVYVKDIAEAIKSLASMDNTKDAYNLVPELISYKEFIETLRNIVDVPYQEFYLSDDELNSYGIFLPYNYYKQENILYDGTRIVDDTNLEYTSIQDGIAKTYKALKSDLKR